MKKTFLTEIFRLAKFIQLVPQTVHELTDLQDRYIEVRFTITSLSSSLFHPNRVLKKDIIVRTLTMAVLIKI